MSTPDETTVWIGLDIGKTEHFADVLDEAGSPLFASIAPSRTTRPRIEALIAARIARSPVGEAGKRLQGPGEVGSPALVASTSPARWPGWLCSPSPPAAACRWRYVPGLVMRRAADLYPGESKTDRRDAFVLADTGRTRRHQVHWLDAGDDELLVQLRVLNGYDTDLAADATRLSNRLRDALTSVQDRPPRRVPRPWSAYWAPRTPHCGGTGRCSPATRHRRRWPRRVAAASRGRSGSARRASRPRSPRPSPGPSTPRPWSYPARSRWVG